MPKTKWWLPFLFFPLMSYGQDSYGIKGEVVDSANVAIESGNVILLSPSDSSVIKGVHFWAGEFELLGNVITDVIIKVSGEGYQSYFERRTFATDSNSIIDLGTIRLKANSLNLDAVEVVYIKPMFERKLGKLIVNVEGTILSEKGTVIDLLRSAPNVIVKSSGSIEVVNKGSAIIYIDGRRINATEILNSMSANDIERIEVIETPSAKYDAEGNAVIEIITKAGARNGYEGSVGLRGMFRTENQISYWANLSYRKDWFSMYTSFGQYAGTLHEDETYFREIHGAIPTTMENSVERETEHNFDTWGHLKMDFRLDSSSTIFTNYYITREQSKPFVLNTNRIYEDGVYIGNLDSESHGVNKRYTHYLSGGYNLNLIPSNIEMRITGQYTKFTGNSNDDIQQFSNFGSAIENVFKNESFNAIDVYSGRLDVTKEFNDKIKLSLGAKYSDVSNNSGTNFQYRDNDVWVVDSNLVNAFDYREQIVAGYTELTGEINKFSYLAGVRFEWTNMNGNSLTSGDGVVDREYQNLFPNIQLGYKVTDDLILGASYNYRISRPLYQDLNPFVTFIDSLTSLRGNPQLQPSYAHNAEISLIYMEYASIKLGYSKVTNPMFLTVEKNELTNTFSAITKNIESSEKYSIGLVIPWENKWWTTFNSFGYDFNNYAIQDLGNVITSNQPTFYVNLYNEFRIPKLFNIEISYEYASPGSQGFFIGKPYHYLMASLSRKFFNKKLSVNFSMFDPFKFNIERAEASLEAFYVDYSSWSDTRSFMLTLRWSFGKLKDSKMTHTIVSDEKERIKE